MISWVLFIFTVYPGQYYIPAVIEGFTSYDACQIAGEQITANLREIAFKCIKVEK